MFTKNRLLCPHCNVINTSKVIYSRTNKSFGTINRTRKCDGCGHSYSSLELTRRAFNKLLDKIDVTNIIFDAMVSHPKIMEIIEDARQKGKIKKRNRRGSRKGFQG